MTSPNVNSEATNVRTKRFNAAVDKFLELIDDKATSENFRVALPDLKPKVLESARKRIVDELKDAIKEEKKKLMRTYELEEKLEELEALVQEANSRKGKSEQSHDVWRSNIDFSTTLYSRSIPSQKESIATLERELHEIETENKELLARLEDSMGSEEQQRVEACAALDSLEQSIAALDSGPEGGRLQKEIINRLLEDLGPRGMASMPLG